MATKSMVSLPYPFSLEDELRRNPELKISDIEMLREWCEKQKHLPRMPDLYLLLFLHSNYYSMEAAKSTVESFFTIRTHVPEHFSNRDPFGTKELRQAFNIAFVGQLAEPSKQGYKILLGKLVDPDPSLYSFDEVTKYFFMFADLLGLKNGACDGYIFIADVSNVSFGHVGRLSPMGMKKLVTYIQDGIPVRLKSIHFIHTHPVMDMVMNMAKPFMKKELWHMIHFHSTLETLEEYLSVEQLPNEFGGKSGSVSKMREENIKELEDKREWFIEEEKLCRVNESLRMDKSVNSNYLFGVDGTFKKLELD